MASKGFQANLIASYFFALFLLTLTLSFQDCTGLICYNYSSTGIDYLPRAAPVASGCGSCTRGVYSAGWPKKSIYSQPDVYSWLCSKMAVNLPVANSYLPPGYEPVVPECAMGSFEVASPSAGYLALCTCCSDYCNIDVECKTFPPMSYSSPNRITIRAPPQQPAAHIPQLAPHLCSGRLCSTTLFNIISLLTWLCIQSSTSI